MEDGFSIITVVAGIIGQEVATIVVLRQEGIMIDILVGESVLVQVIIAIEIIILTTTILITRAIHLDRITAIITVARVALTVQVGRVFTEAI